MPYIKPLDYTDYPKLERDKTFQKACRRAIEIQREIDELEAELAELKEDIEPSLKAGGVKVNTTVMFDGIPIAVRDQSSGSRISEELLLQNGVKRSVIDKSKIENKRKHYVEVGSKQRKSTSQRGDGAADGEVLKFDSARKASSSRR